QSHDPEARQALQRNLDEEEGRLAPEGARAVSHRELWLRFARALGGDASAAGVSPATRAAAGELRAAVEAGEPEALGALWAYEQQTARVAQSKREGLAKKYGIAGERDVEFFALHESLDRHHAADLAAALSRAAARDPQAVDRACAAAA